MGVKGLSTFFDRNPKLSKSHKLHDTSIIIDGNNLLHFLYFSNKTDCIYGGDYNKYARAIKKYFTAFFDCNIKPIVIFDGGYDRSDKKFKTLLFRAKSRLAITKLIEKYGECSGSVLPILSKNVFISVLIELGIPFAQSDYEADDQIMSLANHYKCPVLSNDSDFYIFDIQCGFIRLSSVNATPVCTGEQNSKHLQCSIYHIDTFLSYFPSINKDVLPLFGTLVGNDVAESREFNAFFANVRLPPHRYKGLVLNPKQKKIMGLLNWLKHFSLEDAKFQVLNHLKLRRREHIESVIDLSVRGYKTHNNILALFIDNEISHFKLKCPGSLMLTAPCGEVLPLEFVTLYHQGRLPSNFINIINLHRIFLQSQVESSSWESSYDSSKFIRQVTYGILLNHGGIQTDNHDEKCMIDVEEYGRQRGRLVRTVLKPVYTISDNRALPTLDGLYKLNRSDLRNLLFQVFNLDALYVAQMPNDWELMFCSVNFWLNNCMPKPKEELVYSVILNLMYFYILKQTTFSEMETQKLSFEDMIGNLPVLSILKSVTQAEALFAIKNLKKFTNKPVLNRANPLYVDIVHNISQMQTCVLYSMDLNSLLNCPLEQPKIQNCYSGIMLYNLTLDITCRPYPDLFVAELLGRQSTVFALFLALKTRILGNVSSDCFVSLHCENRKLNVDPKKRSKKKRKSINVVETEPDIACLDEVDKALGEIYL